MIKKRGGWRTPARVGVEGDSGCDGGVGVLGARREWLREMREAESAGDGKEER